MTYKKLGVVFLAAASVGVWAGGCGAGGGSDVPCSTDTDCETNQLCHPTLDICVATCTQGSDCPDEMKTCASLNGSGLFCQCANNDALCNTAVEGNICSTGDKVCRPKCTGDSDCSSGRTCNTTTGQCSAGGGSCSSSDTQPSTCSNGYYCSSATCTAVPAPTCDNFTASAHAATWTAASAGPVIYDISKVSFANDAGFCGGGSPVRVKVHVKAYAKGSTLLPASESSLPGMLHYVQTNGTEGSLTSSVQNYTVNSGNTQGEFDLNFCRPSGSTTFSLGLHFVNGNEYCAQVSM
jgi:hypothetical protein